MRVGATDLECEVLVVAEIGNNHEGDLGRAREMVRAAAEAGVGAVKLQTFRTDLFANPLDPDRVEQLRRFELPFEAFEELAELAASLDVAFLSTPLDLESAALVMRIADAVKVASGDLTFGPLIRTVAKGSKPLLVSTGIAEIGAVEQAVGWIEGERGATTLRGSVALLHCVSAYPAPQEQLNLRAIETLRERFELTVGYSDHSLGIVAAIAATAIGARVIEKHFTLAGINSDFRDHALSADPEEMRALVEGVRSAATMVGSGEKVVQPVEEPMLQAARRSVVAARELPEGHVLEPDDITWMRPGSGLGPDRGGELVGRRLLRGVQPGEPLTPEDVG